MQTGSEEMLVKVVSCIVGNVGFCVLNFSGHSKSEFGDFDDLH